MLGLLEINWPTPVKIRDVAVLGEDGMLRADSVRQELTLYGKAEAAVDAPAPEGRVAGASKGPVARLPVAGHEPIAAEVAAFVDAVLRHATVPVTGEDGLVALRLALALIRSASQRRVRAEIAAEVGEVPSNVG